MHPLDIIVCMKPVPDPASWRKLALDPATMLLRRSGLPAVMNPLDRHAIREAVALTRARGGTVSVVTMAPPGAETQLMEALAMGANAAWHLSDPAFAGADTLATARVLAAAIARLDRHDLVFCGAWSLDGSTSQVGPQVAELLGIPDITHAARIAVDGGTLTAWCDAEGGGGSEEWMSPLPALVTFAVQPDPGDLATMAGIRGALAAPIVTWGARDLQLDPRDVGLAGSPSQMLSISTARTGRKGDILTGSVAEQVTALLARVRLPGEVPR